jgi:hypothetical protein
MDKDESSDKSTSGKVINKKASTVKKAAPVVLAKTRTSPVPNGESKTPRKSNNSQKPEEPVTSAKNKATPAESKFVTTKPQRKPKHSRA